MKLVTWNTQWCCGLDGAVSPARIVQGARALCDFDVLCLQEVCVNFPGLTGSPAHDQPALIRDLLPGFEVFFGAAVHGWSATGPQQFGNLVATRLPVHQVQHHALPYPADPGVRSMPRMCTVVTVQDPALGAVRVMTTHLEYYSKPQRLAQARAVLELHLQACEQARHPPAFCDDGSPFQSRAHTPHAVVCGDFNLRDDEAEYALLTQGPAQDQLWDCWRLLHSPAPQPPTFRVFDRRYGPDPVACDFVFVSPQLRPRVRRVAVDGLTQASDHQPVMVDLG